MKSAILITARLKSTRLPRKVIKNIKGRPMICHMIDRLKLARRPDEIIMCTSPISEDDPLAEIALQEGIECYRGDPVDVLLRLTMAAKEFGVDTVISCTADNPFVDPYAIDRMVDFHISNGFDFTKMEGLPFGVFSYAVSRQAMIKACECKDESDTEVWHGYFSDTGLFKTGILNFDDPAVRWPDLRLTVDTKEDFELVCCIFDELYEEGKIFSIEEIVSLCRRRSDLVAINSDIVQKAGLPIKLKGDDDGGEG